MIDTIMTYIKDEIASEKLEHIDSHEDLLGTGILDSIGMIKLISYLEKEFKIKVRSEDMNVENFMTVENISKFVSNLRG